MISVISLYVALVLRFESFSIPEMKIVHIEVFGLIIICSQFLLFNIMGLYRGMWRFSSMTDLLRIIRASVYGNCVALIVIFFWNRLGGFPRSVIIIDTLILIIGLGGGRLIYRLFKDNGLGILIPSSARRSGSNVLIIGAGSAGNQLLKDINSNPNLALSVVGFIDDDKNKIGRTIQGVNVISNVDRLEKVIRQKDITKVFIAVPSATGDQLKKIIKKCNESNVEFKTLPKINDILSGKIELSLLRGINLEDLLGRDPINLDVNRLGEMINDKTIMVTGAGGSIGSELCAQLSTFNPKTIVLFEISEFFLYQLEMNLKDKFPEVEFIACIGDVRSEGRVNSVLEKYQPSFILHAAAYKHVPMMEENPQEAIFTNILGTKVLAEAAIKNNVERFVMISTDKAVNPTNVMGTTKKIAELICQNLYQKNKTTKFTTVRFGNVLGSNGSVIPLFKKQIEKGGPITVTHPSVTRFFMSIPEACQLVLQSASMGDGGEVFVLDMGSMVKIVDLATNLIKLSGLEPYVDIDIEFTGLRPGEKLYEELHQSSEELLETMHKKVSKLDSKEIEVEFGEKLDALLSLNYGEEKENIYISLQAIVAEFRPTQNN